MSGFVSIAYEDSIELLTDAAMYRPDGTLTGIRSKVFVSSVLPMAVTGRGTTLAVELMANTIVKLAAAAGNFDRLVSRLEDLALKPWRDNEDQIPAYCEMLIAGFSEEHGPQHWFFATHDRQPGIAPFKVIPAPRDCFAGPPVSAADGLPLAGPVGPGFLAKHGVEIMEVMRRKRVPDLVLGTDGYGIGGRCDLTTITARGVTTVTLRTWPDKVGQKIDPFAGQNVTPIAGTNRQKRRAAERQQKRA